MVEEGEKERGRRREKGRREGKRGEVVVRVGGGL